MYKQSCMFVHICASKVQYEYHQQCINMSYQQPWFIPPQKSIQFTASILPTTKLCQTKYWKGMPSLYSTCETLISNQFWLTSSATGSWYSWISMPATHTQGTMNEILLGSNFVASQIIDDMNIQRSTDKLLNHVEFQCCFAKLSACSSELANCLQIFYRWMPYQLACRAFQCIDHFLETGRPLWTYSLYLDQLPFTGNLNDFEVVDQFYVYFVRNSENA